MDPSFEQRLRDEVIYLHSLWHQGPPTSSNPNTNPTINNPNPNSYPNPTNNSNRKRNRKARNKRERANKKKPSQPDPPPHSAPPWPCLTPPHDSTPGASLPWPTKPNSAPATHRPSPEEQAKLAELKLQHNALDACRGLFLGNAGSDSEESESESEEDESGDGDDYWVEGGESEGYKVLLNVFVEKSELRSYYEVNYEKGEFYCLVCGGLGKNKWVKGCAGLVQHSISISNTKKKRAHRAFAQVVCRVLGWDFNRLPTIVLKGERLGLALEKPSQERGETGVNAGSSEGVSVVVEDNVAAENDANAEYGEKETFDDHQNKGKQLMICENSLKYDDTNESTESTEKGIPEMEANKEAVDTWNSFKDNGTIKSSESIDKGISETGTNKEAVDTSGIDQSLVSKTEWPCKESSVSSSTVLGWPTFSSQSASATCSIPEEEQARSATLLLQQKALKECQDFFAGYSGEDISEDEDEGDLMDEDGSDESEELKFFSKIFTDHGELRSFYVNNYNGGEFYCLVCGGVGKKVWKRFKGCVALLQHSITILKTKKVAHRAYGQVIFKVLGWDIGQPPTIGSKDIPLDDGPLAKSDNLQGELEENADDHEDNVVVPKENLDSVSDHIGETVSKQKSDVVQSTGTSKICELQGEVEENADDHNDIAAVSNEKLDSVSNHSGEIISKKESDVVQSNGASKTCELRGELEENPDDHKDIAAVSMENLDSMSGHSGEIVSKEESDAVQRNGASKTCKLQGELEEDGDDHKANAVVSKESLGSMSGHNGEIVSTEESDVVQSDGTSKTSELQGKTKTNAGGPNEDLNVFYGEFRPFVNSDNIDRVSGQA
ncbi:uncharacterized protein Pyn_06764 [Prunus yedoensis var. nudiflora]|uniref:Uncharacterized protein n=1 Tax=Prunus yedoensis var. nudiflora TaxID=2094558 RepID=A0A314UUW9_PRUYE|nr:uncharacterized protein Pyn_06764 [Prunus yedoensis var. nudiflora]